MPLRPIALAHPTVDLAQTAMTVRDEPPPAARIGQRERLLIAGLAAVSVEAIGMGGDVAEQVQGIGPKAEVTSRGCSRCRSPRETLCPSSLPKPPENSLTN